MMENITTGVHGHALMVATIGAPHKLIKIITTSRIIGGNVLLNAMFPLKIQDVSNIFIAFVNLCAHLEFSRIIFRNMIFFNL